MKRTLFSLAGLLLLLFAGHWAVKAASSNLSASKTSAPPSDLHASTSAEATPAAVHALEREGAGYVLEIRGIGSAVDKYGRTRVWELIQQKHDSHSSFLSRDPKDYDLAQDEQAATRRSGGAFRDTAINSVEYWPLPVILLGPEVDPHDEDIAQWLTGLRQQATLGVTLLLYQESARTTSAEAALERLFQFFDEHPDVPEAVVMSLDGETMRTIGRRNRSLHVPEYPDAMAGILVSRSDRVDRLIRPYVVKDVPGSINKFDTQYDTIKLWNFFWSKRLVYMGISEKQEEARGVIGTSGFGTPKADWWIQQLPQLWQQTATGKDGFKPSPYIPVRWTDWQLEQFDQAPLLGYLHRPVKVMLHDAQGQPLKPAEQVAALKAGWQQAVASLPEGSKPERVFYDTSEHKNWVVPLTQALQDNAEALSLDDVDTGYDIGYRVGKTGVSSALLQIGLATVAGYDDGKISATINLGADGNVGILMVSPPDAEAKQRNVENPFNVY